MNPLENNPLLVFEQLFAGRTDLPSTDEATVDPRVLERLRVLDYVHGDLTRFAKRLGTEDRQYLQSHLDAVRNRQATLEGLLNQPRQSCGALTAPAAAVVNEGNSAILSHLMLDMTFDAMRCGIARSYAITYFDSNGYDIVFSWLRDRDPRFLSDPEQAGDNDDATSPHFHSLAHGCEAEPRKTLYNLANQWHFEQLAYLMGKLAAEPEGDGTMLDNTLILWMDALAHGGGHSVRNMPWVLAGNTNNYFSSGRLVEVGSDVAHNQLLQSITHAFGVPVDTFGLDRWPGEMGGLTG